MADSGSSQPTGTTGTTTTTSKTIATATATTTTTTTTTTVYLPPPPLLRVFSFFNNLLIFIHHHYHTITTSTRQRVGNGSTTTTTRPTTTQTATLAGARDASRLEPQVCYIYIYISLFLNSTNDYLGIYCASGHHHQHYSTQRRQRGLEPLMGKERAGEGDKGRDSRRICRMRLEPQVCFFYTLLTFLYITFFCLFRITYHLF